MTTVMTFGGNPCAVWRTNRNGADDANDVSVCASMPLQEKHRNLVSRGLLLPLLPRDGRTWSRSMPPEKRRKKPSPLSRTESGKCVSGRRIGAKTACRNGETPCSKNTVSITSSTADANSVCNVRCTNVRCKKDVRRMYDVQMYDVRGGQSSIQAKRTPQGAFFLPSYINFTSYIVPSYINFTSYMVPSYFFCRFFFFFLHICKKKCIFAR